MVDFMIEFPCGLEVRQRYWGWYFGDVEWRILYDKGCPIHGKNCPNKNKTRGE